MTSLDSTNISTITGSNSHSFMSNSTETTMPPNYDELDPPPSYSVLFPGKYDTTASTTDVSLPGSSVTLMPQPPSSLQSIGLETHDHQHTSTTILHPGHWMIIWIDDNLSFKRNHPHLPFWPRLINLIIFKLHIIILRSWSSSTPPPPILFHFLILITYYHNFNAKSDRIEE